jgi:cyclopropane-fatty-acyl-phospholipid synthase
MGELSVPAQAIAAHYDFANDFYLKFLDPTRCYSQAVFERDDETLEVAQLRKLTFVVESCGLQPGDRVLDVGGGWGAFTEHTGRQGIHVTSLTISRQSETYLTDLIQRLRLPAEVRNQDFLKHDQPKPCDAIVILGVMEHLPDYAAVLRQVLRLLKPGGRVYLDASAFRKKICQARIRLALYLSGRPLLLLPARISRRDGRDASGRAGGIQRPS